MVLRFFDGATIGRKVPDEVPGMDRWWWTEADCEEKWEGDAIDKINTNLLTASQPQEVKPWPLLVPSRAPVDWSRSYRGFDVQTWVQNYANAEAWGQVNSARLYIDDPDAYSPVLSRTDQNLGQQETTDQLRAAAPAGGKLASDWVRLPWLNEPGLKQPAIGVFRGLSGGKFALELKDQDYFAPFDLTHPERYTFHDDKGAPIDHGEVYARLNFNDRVNIYLRARRWRYYVRVLVHYLYFTWVEEVQNDEWFLYVFYDRPPFYPIRQEVADNRTPTIWHEWESIWCGYDPGVNWKFDHSIAATELSRQIFDQQWFTLCAGYVYIGNEAATITVWRCPPRPGEYVAGFGAVSRATGEETGRVWVKQVEDATARYPRTVLGVFYDDWVPTGDNSFLGAGGLY